MTITQRAMDLEGKLASTDARLREFSDSYPRIRIGSGWNDSLMADARDTLELSRNIRARPEANAKAVADKLDSAALDLAKDSGNLYVGYMNNITFGSNWNEKGPLEAVREALRLLTADAP